MGKKEEEIKLGNEFEQSSLEVSIVGNHAVYGRPGADGKIVVFANSSAAMTVGVKIPDITAYDGADSGLQMLAFCPPDSLLPVQFPGDKLTEPNVALAHSMYQLAAESLKRLGFDISLTLIPTPNMHDFLEDHLRSSPDARILPMFASERVLGMLSPDTIHARATETFNNKSELLRLLAARGLGAHLAHTYFYDQAAYPDTGFPSPEAIAADTPAGRLVFLKEDVSAGGHGVEGIDPRSPSFEARYNHWVSNMRQAREIGSHQKDFHIQIGVPVDTSKPIKSPCIIGVIRADGSARILQVALQRLAGGTAHIGNVIDRDYEARFLRDHGGLMLQVFQIMSEFGLRGHAGIDVIEGTDGIYLIEVNPRYNGNSVLRQIRDRLPDDAQVATNNTFVLSEANISLLGDLRKHFYDAHSPHSPAIAFTRAPRYAGDGFGLVFINDQDGELEEKVVKHLNIGI